MKRKDHNDLLDWATGEMARGESLSLYVFCAALGAMKTGEGIMQHCPVKDVMDSAENVESDPAEKIILP